MSTTIKNRWTGAVLFEHPGTLAEALQAAIASCANLSRADLSGANLSDADLSRASLIRADLSRANLSRASLIRADLSRANLSGADLSRADLSRASLIRADLSRANLSGADLSRANLSGADLSRADLALCLPVGDPRGYRPVAVWHGDRWIVYSGCRAKTIAKAREHWGTGYAGNRTTGDQYLVACDWLERQPVPVVESAERPGNE
jgi:hypothetical protein